jgi:hypothetical protein
MESRNWNMAGAAIQIKASSVARVRSCHLPAHCMATVQRQPHGSVEQVAREHGRRRHVLWGQWSHNMQIASW